MQLQLETTNVCQAACVFCPYPAMTRPKGTMSMSLFRKIIDEAATIPAVDKFTLTGLGEPLLDRFIADRIRYIRSVIPAAFIDLYTNGSFLRAPMVHSLIDAGLSMLYVSLNAVSSEKRLAVMKLDDYDQVVSYIQYAQEAVKLTNSTMEIVVKCVVAKDLMEGGDVGQFVQFWKGEYGVDNGGAAFRHLEGNWAGSMWPMRVQLKSACDRALNQIMVLQDGRVSLCCFDADGKKILGDLNHQSIREVFNGPDATFVREAHWEGRRSDVDLCAACTGI